MRRICARPSTSGSENSTRRSNRPGRSNAVSSVSGLKRGQHIVTIDHQGNIPIGGHKNLDVPSRVETVQLVEKLQHRTLDFTLATRGRIITANTSTTETCTAQQAAYRFVPMASISSMKTILGACSSATLKSSRTSLGPSPRYFWMSSEPTTRRKVADV